MAGYLNGDGLSCPATNSFDRLADSVESLNQTINELRRDLVKPATDANRIDVSIVRSQLRDHRLFFGAAVAVFALTNFFFIFWFTGLKPSIKTSGTTFEAHATENGKN